MIEVKQFHPGGRPVQTAELPLSGTTTATQTANRDMANMLCGREVGCHACNNVISLPCTGAIHCLKYITKASPCRQD